MSEEPKKKWVSDSIHGALLFLLFHERIQHPNTYSAAEIFDHPSLPFRCYSKKNFKTYCSTAANRCIKFERDGTGLTKAFKGFIAEARKEFKDLLTELKGSEDSEEEDDGTYIDNEEEDIELDPEFEVEEDDDIEILGNNLRHSKLEDPPTAVSSQNRMPKKMRTPKKMTNKAPRPSNQNTPTKSLTKLADGRLFASWKLETNWDGEIYLSDDCLSIMQDSIYPKNKYFHAPELMKGTGINNLNHVFQNNMQVERKATYEAFYANNPDRRSAGPTDVVVSEEVFRLPVKVKNKYFDFNGTEQDEVPVDMLQTGEWAMLVLEVQHDSPKARPKIRRRGIRNDGGAGTVRGRDENSQPPPSNSRARSDASGDTNMYQDSNQVDPDL